MNLPPRWKVKREAWRIREQATRFLVGSFFDPPRMMLYRLRFDRIVRVETGKLAETGKIAIVVLFQPHGLSRSTLFMLDHLIANDYAPVIVSNSELSPDDWAAVAGRSLFLVRRPNAGYDFGGYRDGLAVLRREGLAAERLVLMNDSTWFPLWTGDDSIARMEALGADLAGHVFKTESEEKKGRDHVESHFLMFSSEFQQSPAFKRFWDSYVMSDTRELTVARGEKSISQLALGSGGAVEALLSRQKLLAGLCVLEDEALLEAIESLVHHREDAKEYCGRLVFAARSGQPWRDEFLNWVDVELRNSRQHLASSTFVAPAMKMGLLGFVKKSTDRRHHLARQKVLEMAKSGETAPLAPEVEAEISATVANWVPPFDWRSPARS